MMKKKYSITLLEIMIVIFLIGLIGSVVGVKVKGSMDRGRAFATSQAAKTIENVLLLEVANGVSIDDVVKNPHQYLQRSGMVQDVDKMLKDAWNTPFKIDKKGAHGISVDSKNLEEYEKAHDIAPSKEAQKPEDSFRYSTEDADESSS